jgi:hypothetical protein
MRPSKDELTDFWKHAYSRSAFIQASCRLHLIEGVKTNPVILQSVLDAMIIAYARPFTTSRVPPNTQLRPLLGIDPPPSLKQAHNDLISLRHKVVGHKDAIPEATHTDTPNMVLAVVEEKDLVFHTTTVGDMDSRRQADVKALCEFFICHCDEQMKEFVTKYGRDIRAKGLGTYQIVISEPPDEWLRPHLPGIN